MPWPIIDVNGFDGLRIGDMRSAVRERFGDYRTSRRGSTEFDYFDEAGVMAYFGTEERVTFIEICAPAEPEIRGASLLSRELVALLEDFESIGVRYIPDEAPGAEGGFLDDLNVGLWIPGSIVEAVSIGPRGDDWGLVSQHFES